MKICIKCGKEFEGEYQYCGDCRTDMIRQYVNAAETFRESFDFKRSLEMCDEILKVDPKNLIAINLKEDIQKTHKEIDDFKALAQEAFDSNKFDEEVFYLEKILQLNPKDEEASRRKELASVLVKVDADRYGMSAEDQENSTKDFLTRLVKHKYFPWFACISALFLAVLITDSASKWYVERERAKLIYHNIQKKVSAKDYNSTAFLEDYEKLTDEFSDTAYGRKAKKELAKYYGEARKRIAQDVNNIIASGQMYYDRGDYGKAISEWNKALQIDPYNEHVKSIIRMAKNRFMFSSEMTSSSDRHMSTYNELMEKAKKAEVKRDFTAAIGFYQDARNYNIDDTTAYQKIRELTEKLKRYEMKKSAELSKIKDTSGNNIGFDEAQNINRQKTQALAIAKGKEKEMASLRPTAEKEHYIPPPRARTHLMRGQDYFDKGEYSKAILEWRKAAKLDPLKTDFLQELIEKVEKIIERENKGYYLWYKKALECEKEQLWENAITAYQRCLEYKPGDEVAKERLEVLAAVRYTSKRKDDITIKEISEKAITGVKKTIEEYSEASKLPLIPPSKNVDFEYVEKNPVVSRENGEQVQKPVPVSNDTNSEKSTEIPTLSELDRQIIELEEAEKDKQAISKKLSVEKVLESGAESQTEEVSLADKDGSDKNNIWYMKATAWVTKYLEKRNVAKSFRYEKLIALAYDAESDGDFVKANEYYLRAYKLNKKNEIKETIELNNIITETKKIVISKPNSFYARITLGSSYYAKGYFDRAIKVWEDALAKDPRDIFTKLLINALLGKAYQESGNVSKAIEYYEQSIKYGEISYVKTSLGHAYWEIGELEKAIAIFEELFENGAYQIDVATALSKAYASIGLEDLALKILIQLEQMSIKELKDRQIYPQDVSPDNYVFNSNQQIIKLFRQLQVYPSEVTPDYFVVSISQDRAFGNSVYGLAEAYALSGSGNDAARWLQIYINMAPPDERGKRKQIILNDPDFQDLDLDALLFGKAPAKKAKAQDQKAVETPQDNEKETEKDPEAVKDAEASGSPESAEQIIDSAEEPDLKPVSD